MMLFMPGDSSITGSARFLVGYSESLKGVNQKPQAVMDERGKGKALEGINPMRRYPDRSRIHMLMYILEKMKASTKRRMGKTQYGAAGFNLARVWQAPKL
jgi:hypothetical protein